MSNFQHLDLNHLLTLDALLSERSVSRAARRLNYSQPSVSVQLSKLRFVFNDPLLVPGARGMIPTARAVALQEPLRRALETLNKAILPVEPFDPRKASHTWPVAAADYGEFVILLPALSRMRKDAPGTRLAVSQVVPMKVVRSLESGEIDLALQMTDHVPPGLHHQTLFSERYVLVGRRDHPRLKRKLTIDEFCALDHVVISPDGGGFYGVTDESLLKHGATRRVVLSVPHFLVAISAIETTDLVGMLPFRLVARSGLKVVKAPVEVPGYSMGMVWHRRSDLDPAHIWLRTIIAKSF